MDSQSGLALVIQQWKALHVKNFNLSCRNMLITTTRLLLPFFFLSVLFIIFESSKQRERLSPYDVEALISPPIPPCEEKLFIRHHCFDFVWSRNDSARLALIVSQIMANNPGRSIPPSKVKSCITKKEVDDWLFNNPLRCSGALHIEEISGTVISYGVQTNSIQIYSRGTYENPTFKFQIPLQIAAEREIGRFLIGDPNSSWVVGLKRFPQPVSGGLATKTEELIAGLFFLSIAMFTTVFQINSLVVEKELKLRQAMTIMGLYDTAYWLSWLTWEATFSLLSSLVTVLCGLMFRFPFVLRNNFAIIFLVFFLFQLSMMSFAFMLSTVINKSSSSARMAFLLFTFGFLGQIAQSFSGFPYWTLIPLKYQIMWSLFPPNLLSRAISILFSASATGGMSWSKLSECDNKSHGCAMSLRGVFWWYIFTFFLWLAMTIYLDNIIPNSFGWRKSVFYFLHRGYWTGNGVNKHEEGGIFSCLRSIPLVDHQTADDEDVLEEESAVKHQVTEGLVNSNVAVQLRGLVKTYPGKREIGCCKCNMKSHFHAVKGLWVNIPRDQLFCLLGPNGAGKTTTISCLTGISPVTSGDALIYGYSVASSIGMSNIRKFIGVCPQFDILWDALTGEEHLHLFASIKGIPIASTKLIIDCYSRNNAFTHAQVVQKSLVDVRLTYAGKGRAGSYSGGMKRRLSVAIALIGDPKLVILDEPTTGMDPITRRHVWDIIENAKKGRAIILTTHSMEEADILGDRIAIVAKGMLRCIGTSVRLKSKFGSGLVINVSFSETTMGASKSCVEALKSFFKNHLNVVPKEETKYFVSYVIPHKDESLLRKFFVDLQEREREFGIADIQLGLTTLEEVFLNVAKKAALETAEAENNMATLTLESGTSLLIPMGVEHIGIPGSVSNENLRGLMVEVYWGQDSNGNLCLTGHSAEMPIPEEINFTFPPMLPNGNSPHGILLDMKEFQNATCDVGPV